MTEGVKLGLPEQEIRSQIRVLIVAKDISIRTMLEAIVEPNVQKMDTAQGVEEALTKLNMEPGKYNALITDNDLDKEDGGLELARRATEQFPNLVCVLVVPNDNLPDKAVLERNGVRFFFRKPFRVQTITDVVDRIRKVISKQGNR